MDRETLAQLSKAELIALILAQAEVIAQQAAQIAVLTRRVEELEAKLGTPPKTPANSSLLPRRGEKRNRAERRASRRKGHPGAFRALAEHPDRVIESYAALCPHCARGLAPADQPGFDAGACPRAARSADPGDHIELPPLRPVVTRIHRHRGICPGCRRAFSAPPPAGLAPGSPFGPALCALLLPLHVTQAIGFERLSRLMDEVFGVAVSAGALANILARAEAPMIIAAEAVANRSAPARWSPRMRLRRGSGAKPGGSGCCCPRPRSIPASPTAAAPRSSPIFCAAPRPRCGGPTAMAARMGMVSSARSASPICCAMRNMPSTPATPVLRPASSPC